MAKTLHLSKIIISNDGDPIINGGLLTENLKITAVGKKEDFGSLENFTGKIIDHKEALICPGFINLHTHLLYSSIKNIDGSGGLFPWLESLIDEISYMEEKDFIKSINYGINQALSCGTTYIVENTPNELSAKILAKNQLKALIGLEVFGSDEKEASEIFLGKLDLLKTLKSNYKNLDFTFSPHAPYDVSKSLWEKLINWSEESNVPLLTHLEESREEKSWWQEKSGPGVKFWKKIKKLEPKLKYWKKYNSGIDFLNKNNLLTKNLITTHLTQATRDDLILLKDKNIKLVHCPRSNNYLNNNTANIKLWDELGFLWGLGTDSTASNKNLDLLEELRFAINQQDLVYNYKIQAKDAFKLITSDAAKIISKDLGYLKKGYYGDFLIFNIKDKPGCTYTDPYHLLIWETNNNNDLKEVWINSEKVWIAKQLLHKI